MQFRDTKSLTLWLSSPELHKSMEFLNEPEKQPFNYKFTMETVNLDFTWGKY
jgi:hypothetical protein